MTKKLQPLMIIIAGPNGSGKTTLAPFFLKKMKIKEFLNSDEIARGLSPYNAEAHIVSAGKILIKRIEDAIECGISFAVETTLSGNYPAHYIHLAKKNNYSVLMIYFYTNDVIINLKRVTNRVKEGGHNVPKADVIRRYFRSLKNLFFNFAPICDKIELYDVTEGELNFMASSVPNGQNAAIWAFNSKYSKTWEHIQETIELDE